MSQHDSDGGIPAGHTVIYTRFITRKGVRIPPPRGLKVWRLVVPIRRPR